MKQWENEVSTATNDFEHRDCLLLPVKHEYTPKGWCGNTGSAKVPSSLARYTTSTFPIFSQSNSKIGFPRRNSLMRKNCGTCYIVWLDALKISLRFKNGSVMCDLIISSLMRRDRLRLPVFFPGLMKRSILRRLPFKKH
jgi:hypothetical protein